MLPRLTQSIHSVLISRTFLNVISIIAGISFWNMVTQQFCCTHQSALPLVFDNATDASIIQAPESIQVTLSGPRAALRESAHLGAIHVDAHTLKPGKQLLHISEQHLLVPTAAKLLHYTPVAIIVTPVLP